MNTPELGNNSGRYSGTGTFSGIGPITAFSVTNPDPNGGTGEELFFNNAPVVTPASAPELPPGDPECWPPGRLWFSTSTAASLVLLKCSTTL